MRLAVTISYDHAAEAAIISACLLDKMALATAVSSLKDPECFDNKNLRILFDAMSDMYKNGEDVDVITLSEKLKSAGTLERVGGTPFISDILDVVTSGANVKPHIDLIIKYYRIRKLNEIANRVRSMCSAGDDPGKIYSTLEGETRNIFTQGDDENSHVSRFVVDMVNSFSTERETDLQSFGLSSIDRLIMGIEKGTLVTIAARPSMGKTSLSLEFAYHFAVNCSIPTAFISLETDSDRLLRSIISSQAEIDRDNLKFKSVNKEETEKIVNIGDMLSDSPLYLLDKVPARFEDILITMRRYVYEHDIKIFFVDYLQLIHMGKSSGNRNNDVSQITRALKAFAREEGIRIIALSQLNRQVESRPRDERRPRLSDLRESGSIEQDSDIVMFIYRDSYYDKFKRNEIGQAEVIVAKNREGALGTAYLTFYPSWTSFRNCDQPMIDL